MIPNINNRGFSFKGLIAYLMHDKHRTDSSERVAWSMTGNMLTDDPFAAAKVMAWTDENASILKANAGISTAGAKPTSGAVYHYSLSWEKSDHPNNDHMQQSARSSLERLGLQEHQYVLVCHTDTKNPHVHIAVNLTHPTTGKRNEIKSTKRILQKWASEYEHVHGIHCHMREANARRREQGEGIKHQDQKKDYARSVTLAYERADSGRAFVQALHAEGLELALARRGNGFVIVDAKGDIQKLARQLDIVDKGRAKSAAINAKMADLDRTSMDYGDVVAARIITGEKINISPDPLHNRALVRQAEAKDVLENVARHHAAFDRRILLRAARMLCTDAHKAHILTESVLSLPNICAVGRKDGRDYYATSEMIRTEKDLISDAVSMAGKASHNTDSSHVMQAIHHLNAVLKSESGGSAELSSAQLKTIRHMTDGKQLSLVTGIAGSGKTTALAAARAAWEAQGYRVRGAALSGIAAENIQSSGIASGTLHGLEHKMNKAQHMLSQCAGKPLSAQQSAFIKDAMLSPQDILVIDEAGMVSACQMQRVLQAARLSGAKVVLVGDDRQLQSIEAGAAFRTINKRIDAVSLEEVRRQKKAWMRDATVDFARGAIEKALQAYQERGHIVFQKDHQRATAALVADYMDSFTKERDHSRIALAFTRKDVSDLNRMIRAEMQARKFSDFIEKKFTVSWRQGDEQHYEEQGFSAGDRIMFRENNKSLGVMNGTLGTVSYIDGDQLCVAIDGGREVRFSAREYNAFTLGYAATVHKTQGVTVDESYVLASKNFDRHTAYVAMSRHKNTVKMYAASDDFPQPQALYECLSKDGGQLSTLDFNGDSRSASADQKPSAAPISALKSVWKKITRKPKKRPERTQPVTSPMSKTSETLKGDYNRAVTPSIPEKTIPKAQDKDERARKKRRERDFDMGMQ